MMLIRGIVAIVLVSSNFGKSVADYRCMCSYAIEKPVFESVSERTNVSLYCYVITLINIVYNKQYVQM